MNIKFIISVYELGKKTGIFKNITIEDTIDYNNAIDELYRMLKKEYKNHKFVIREIELF